MGVPNLPKGPLFATKWAKMGVYEGVKVHFLLQSGPQGFIKGVRSKRSPFWSSAPLPLPPPKKKSSLATGLADLMINKDLDWFKIGS